MSGQNIQIPYLDGQFLELQVEEGELSAEAKAALASFLASTSDQRLADAAKVFGYYQDFRGDGDFAEWLDDELGILNDDATIWSRVTLRYLDVCEGMNGLWYVVVSGDCDWDEEHGIMMVWLQGSTLTRVGPDDGDLGDNAEDAETDKTDTVYL